MNEVRRVLLQGRVRRFMGHGSRTITTGYGAARAAPWSGVKTATDPSFPVQSGHERGTFWEADASASKVCRTTAGAGATRTRLQSQPRVALRIGGQPVRRITPRGLVLGIVLVLSVALAAAAWPYLQRYVGVRPPDQFYAQLDPALVKPDAPVVGIAHNVGNNPATTAAALHYGADVIEIDVFSARGQLVAGRDQPLPRVAGRMFRGYTLAEMWERAAPADIIKLDLKQTDRSFLDALAGFLTPLARLHKVMISTGDPAAVSYLHAVLPSVTLLFSIGWPDELAALRADPDLVRDIGGVSVFQGLVDAGLVSWMHQRRLLVLAWTVNDGQRLNELIRLGIDGVTTANLAILQALAMTG